jgi:copper(I)-binding protein
MFRMPRSEFALALLVFILAAGPVLAHSYEVGPLKIGHPWSRATPNGAKVAGGYLTITNTGSEPDRLVGGSFERAGRFEVHEMKVTDGVMTMRPVEGGLAIGAGETVTLAPGGLHLMFQDLKAGLAEKEKVKGTLVFEKAGTVEVEYAVAGMGSKDGTGKPADGHGAHVH